MYKKILLFALAAVLSIAVLPTSSVYASDLMDEPTPSESLELSGERLEKAWERVLRINERVGKKFERADALVEKIQTLIDKATADGKDTTAVQAALDAFGLATEEARPLYDAAQSIIDAHEGFGTDGKVTDAEKAAETIKSLGESLRGIRDVTGESGKALREAIKAYREANPRLKDVEK
ncbi:MAG: hypothetical protein HN390_06320 [Anaerolineae bacterium]|jgi:hypothetical protein|nr:hypothetical protein [Anaerolineae bacterium]MBT7191476.1 hypothetical protein [Anaerolineae bacterium]MBT7989488.1 hypothetical protein [Anaerolineae bacterium]